MTYNELYAALNTSPVIAIFVKKNLEIRCMLATRNTVLAGQHIGYFGSKLDQIDGKCAKSGKTSLAAIDIIVKDVRPINVEHLGYLKVLPNIEWNEMLSKYENFSNQVKAYILPAIESDLSILNNADELNGKIESIKKAKAQFDKFYAQCFE